MNRRYQTAVPKNLLTCLTFFGIGICTIACTFSGSVLSAPSPTMYPRYFRPTICGANPNFRQKSSPRYSDCFNDGHKNNSIGCFWPLYAITTFTWPRI
ncbi:uncharacterized protein LOC117899472 isoform X5 [Drosophila subobscura]|uniref:uncharacterized protein LOC117899472 isoform X5 n=1 Tax=Drosophila subobscura TaxID=7241 RepID=UPI00155A91DB|nr:uncharacterized protein LOC117899472 isoform X5 [Drosophila subobscura]